MKFLPALIVCTLLVSGPVPAMEFKKPNMLVLSPQELELCDEGCSLIPDKLLKEFIEQQTMRAYKAGQQSCGTRV